MKKNNKNIDKIVSNILKETLEKKAEEVIEKIKSKNSEEKMCSECGGEMYEGECMECGSMYESENKIDEFSDEFDYVETDEEVDEGNAFTGALAKAKEKGDDEFTVDGKTYDVKESRNSLQLTEEELIDVIEKLVNEEIGKNNISKGTKPPGLSNYEKAVKGSKKENDEYVKAVTKKLKEYLKSGSQGEYTMEPKIFPAGNGELKKMDKKAYTPSDSVKDYTDNFTAAGLENIVYDEIHPNEEWVTDNMEGSSRTGNNPKWANAVETPTNKKRNQIRKDNLLGAVKQMAYNKAPQPVVDDAEYGTAGKFNKNFGKDSGKKASKILNQLESIDEKQDNLIKEEFKKIERLINYNKKTQ